MSKEKSYTYLVFLWLLFSFLEVHWIFPLTHKVLRITIFLNLRAWKHHFYILFLRILSYFILFFHDNSSFLPFKMSKQQLLRITGILEEEGGFFCIGIKDGEGGKEGALYRQVSGTRHGYNITMERGGHFSPIPFCSWVLFTYFLDSSFFLLISPSSLYILRQKYSEKIYIS